MKVLIFEFIKRIYIRLPKAIKRPTLQLHRFIDLKCHLRDTQYVYDVKLCNYEFRYHRYMFDMLIVNFVKCKCDNIKHISFVLFYASMYRQLLCVYKHDISFIVKLYCGTNIHLRTL